MSDQMTFEILVLENSRLFVAASVFAIGSVISILHIIRRTALPSRAFFYMFSFIAVVLNWFTSALHGGYARWKLHSFDVNGDQVFSGAETASEEFAFFQLYVMHYVKAPFLPLAAIFISIATVILVLLLSSAAYLLKRSYIALRGSKNAPKGG